jgi:hypothetical protein
MKRRTAGFSLIETLIAMVILVMMFLAILSLYTKGQQTFINESALADAMEESRFPLAWIAKDVKMSSSVEASYGSYVTSADTLILKIPSVDANGVIIDLEEHSDRVIYRLEDSRLLRILDAKDGVSARQDKTRVLADGMTGVTFAYFDAAGVQLSSGFQTAASVLPTLASRRYGVQRVFSQSLDTRFMMRNK